MAANLIEELLTPLQIISCGEIRGKVRLQKLVFLSQNLLKKKYNYEFMPAPLGPLSNNLNYLLGIMEESGMIEENTKSTSSGYSVYCYKITDIGKQILSSAKQQKILSVAAVKTISSVYNQYGNMPYVELLNFIHGKYPEYHLKQITLY